MINKNQGKAKKFTCVNETWEFLGYKPFLFYSITLQCFPINTFVSGSLLQEYSIAMAIPSIRLNFERIKFEGWLFVCENFS